MDAMASPLRKACLANMDYLELKASIEFMSCFSPHNATLFDDKRMIFADLGLAQDLNRNMLQRLKETLPSTTQCVYDCSVGFGSNGSDNSLGMLGREEAVVSMKVPLPPGVWFLKLVREFWRAHNLPSDSHPTEWTLDQILSWARLSQAPDYEMDSVLNCPQADDILFRICSTSSYEPDYWHPRGVFMALVRACRLRQTEKKAEEEYMARNWSSLWPGNGDFDYYGLDSAHSLAHSDHFGPTSQAAQSRRGGPGPLKHSFLPTSCSFDDPRRAFKGQRPSLRKRPPEHILTRSRGKCYSSGPPPHSDSDNEDYYSRKGIQTVVKSPPSSPKANRTDESIRIPEALDSSFPNSHPDIHFAQAPSELMDKLLDFSSSLNRDKNLSPPSTPSPSTTPPTFQRQRKLMHDLASQSIKSNNSNGLIGPLQKGSPNFGSNPSCLQPSPPSAPYSQEIRIGSCNKTDPLASSRYSPPPCLDSGYSTFSTTRVVSPPPFPMVLKPYKSSTEMDSLRTSIVAAHDVDSKMEVDRKDYAMVGSDISRKVCFCSDSGLNMMDAIDADDTSDDTDYEPSSCGSSSFGCTPQRSANASVFEDSNGSSLSGFSHDLEVSNPSCDSGFPSPSLAMLPFHRPGQNWLD